MMHTEILDTPAATGALADAWNALVCERAPLNEGLDGTAGYEWFQALCLTHLARRRVQVVVARRGAAVHGVLPVVDMGPGPAGRQLAVASNAYAGRAGVPLDDADGQAWHSLLHGLDRAWPDWASLDLVVTRGSRLEQLLQQHGDQYRPDTSAPLVSPAFALGGDAAAFWAACSKSSRQLVRSARNKLVAAGDLELQLVTDAAEAEGLVDEVMRIERASWKHEAGTAISCHPQQEAFYRAWVPVAARAGQLLAGLLRVGGQPVAHNFGIFRDGVYCCLKHSHDQAFDKSSPVYPLTAHLIDALFERGATHFDFMGKSEPHKMRWSPATFEYARLNARLYRASLRGRTARALQQARRALGSVARRVGTRPQETEA